MLEEMGHKVVMEQAFKSFRLDIYMPDLNTAIEIDGFNHTIPFERKKMTALTLFKRSILQERFGLKVFTFQSYWLNGMARNPDKLKGFLKKIIK